MKELAVKAEQCFEKLYDKVVVVLGTIIFFAFSYYSARYTEILQEEEIIETNVDSVGGNLFFWLLAMAFFVLFRVLLQRMDGEKLHQFACVVKVLSLLYVGVVCVLWISSCYVRPRADASVICKVAGYLYNGDYATMEPPGYMSFCPHQYGMVFLLEQIV